MEYLWCFAQFGKICTILKNVKNTQGGVLLIVKLWAVLKAALLHGCFSQMVPHCVKRLICSSRYKNSELPQSMLRLKKTFSLTHKVLALVVIYVLFTNCFTAELAYANLSLVLISMYWYPCAFCCDCDILRWFLHSKKKVRHTSEFPYSIYWWTWKTNIYLKNCWSRTIKNVRISIFTKLYFFKKTKKNTWRYHYFTPV